MQLKFRWLVFLCMLAAGAVAQVRPRPGQAAAGQSPARKPGSVEGTVVNSVTGEPIKKATVTLHNYRLSAAYAATSDAEGHFRIAGVEPDDSYVPTARCAGFTEESPSRQGVTVSVGEEQTVTGIQVKLVPLGVIAGKVLNEDDDPLPSVAITVYQAAYQMGRKQMRPVRFTQTDDRGEYRLFDLPPGRAYIAASPRVDTLFNVEVHSDRPEEAYPTTFYPAAADLAGATPVAVAPGSETGGLNFRLHKVRSYHIRGKAVDAQSRSPVHGASVQVSVCGSVLENAGPQRAVPLQPDGTFDFPGAVSGPYCLRIQNSNNGHTSFGQETVTVANQDADDVVVGVSSGSEMPGRIVFESAPPENFQQYRVSLRPVESLPSYPSALVKADYTFLFSDVLPTEYALPQIALPQNFYLKSAQYGDQDVSDGRIRVTAGDTPLTLVLASDSARISVTVDTPDGGPPSGTGLLLAPRGRYARRDDLMKIGFVSPNGMGRFLGVAPGEYKLYAFSEPDWNLVRIPEFLKLLETRASSLTLGPSDNQKVQVSIIPAELVNEAKSKLQ